ncbi:hypothetical protein DEO72_LG3g930 [Vigna unguiculata]|uniref:Uncharacterized protein n=1 Tax=Vigna unguiculata TaxID=3917 RepID=A0A4D6LD11_VIGUN|nr:hypothetical protein DEO72_LG3g930 [Vigna unguiculata]
MAAAGHHSLTWPSTAPPLPPSTAVTAVTAVMAAPFHSSSSTRRFQPPSPSSRRPPLHHHHHHSACRFAHGHHSFVNHAVASATTMPLRLHCKSAASFSDHREPPSHSTLNSSQIANHGEFKTQQRELRRSRQQRTTNARHLAQP